VGSPCPHCRTRVIAEDDATTYVECLDCGELFETAELDQPAPAKPEFEEDLSDA
jgi:DNA-directed RNA polymerase subunit RPC12/RpoP